MAKTTHFTPQIPSGMTVVKTFPVMFVVNALVLWVAATLFPQQIVLGTMSMNAVWAILHSMGVLALINTLTMPLVALIEGQLQRAFKPTEWMAYYFVINVVSLWLLARFSDQFGMGLSSWLVAVGLAIVLDVLQGVVMMKLGRYLAD